MNDVMFSPYIHPYRTFPPHSLICLYSTRYDLLFLSFSLFHTHTVSDTLSCPFLSHPYDTHSPVPCYLPYSFSFLPILSCCDV